MECILQGWNQRPHAWLKAEGFFNYLFVLWNDLFKMAITHEIFSHLGKSCGGRLTGPLNIYRDETARLYIQCIVQEIYESGDHEAKVEDNTAYQR